MSTAVRFLSCVKSHVSFKMMISGESFVTDSTFKGFFSSVSSLMVLQNMFVAKRTVASIASKNLVRGKNSFGDFEWKNS